MPRSIASLFAAPFQPRPRNVIAWLVAVVSAATSLTNAWLVDGHATCDFASQWLMGRMVVERRGHEMYWVLAEAEVLALGFAGEQYEELNEQILQKCPRGQEPTGVEGPLYPPPMGLLMAPLSSLSPRAAYSAAALIYVLLGFLTAWCLRDITCGGLRTGEAAAFVLLFPHFAMSLSLGQNSALSLAILTAGWALRCRRWLFVGGLVWGLLAFKPVFAIAVIWAPFVLGNGRMLLGMLMSACLFFLATLPVCGFDIVALSDAGLSLNSDHPWSRWLTVGANASTVYAYDLNWIWMSRDLISLPRRDMWSVDYTVEHVRAMFGSIPWDGWRMQAVDEGAKATWIGRGLLSGVIGLTVSVALAARRRGAPASPLLPAFVLLGALLSTFHFIWYDLLPMALPIALVLAELRRFSTWERAWLVFAGLVIAAAEMNLANGTGPVEWPVETFVLLITWAWLGWRTLRS